MVDLLRRIGHLGLVQPSETFRGVLSELSNVALFALIGYLATIKFLDPSIVGVLLTGYATARWSVKQANGAALAMSQMANGSGGSGTGSSGRMQAIKPPNDDGSSGSGPTSGGGGGGGFVAGRARLTPGEMPATRPGRYEGPGDVHSRRDVLGVAEWLWHHPGVLAWAGTLAAMVAFIAIRALRLR